MRTRFHHLYPQRSLAPFRLAVSCKHPPTSRAGALARPAACVVHHPTTAHAQPSQDTTAMSHYVGNEKLTLYSLVRHRLTVLKLASRTHDASVQGGAEQPESSTPAASSENPPSINNRQKSSLPRYQRSERLLARFQQLPFKTTTTERSSLDRDWAARRTDVRLRPPSSCPAFRPLSQAVRHIRCSPIPAHLEITLRPALR